MNLNNKKWYWKIVILLIMILKNLKINDIGYFIKNTDDLLNE